MNQKNVNQAFIAAAEALAGLEREEQLKVLELVSVNFSLTNPSGGSLDTPIASPGTSNYSDRSRMRNAQKSEGTSRRGRNKKKLDVSEIPFPNLNKIPGDSRRERQFNIAVLAGYEARKQGKNSIMVADVRDLSRHYDTLDTNFSNNVKNENTLFTVKGKGKNARLYITDEGESRAKELHPDEKTKQSSPILMD